VNDEQDNYTAIKERIKSYSLLQTLDLNPDERGNHNIYIKGYQATFILDHYNVIFGDLLHTEKLKLWKETRSILNQIGEGVKEEHVESFIEKINRWYHKIKTFAVGKSWYIHIIVHHCRKLLLSFGGLAKFSNQGFEHLHKVIKRILDDNCQHGINKKEYLYRAIFNAEDGKVRIHSQNCSSATGEGGDGNDSNNGEGNEEGETSAEDNEQQNYQENEEESEENRPDCENEEGESSDNEIQNQNNDEYYDASNPNYNSRTKGTKQRKTKQRNDPRRKQGASPKEAKIVKNCQVVLYFLRTLNLTVKTKQPFNRIELKKGKNIERKIYQPFPRIENAFDNVASSMEYPIKDISKKICNKPAEKDANNGTYDEGGNIDSNNSKDIESHSQDLPRPQQRNPFNSLRNKE
jgi:hypothetical protein